LPNVTGQYGEVCYLFSCNVLSNIDGDKLFTGIPCADLERKVPSDKLAFVSKSKKINKANSPTVKHAMINSVQILHSHFIF